MAVVIAGERSGVGKTTITLALLAALSRRDTTRVQSFKVGPDYIDPMFHQFVTGRACRNLDPILTSEAYVTDCFQRHCQTADFALVEGVMGLFDGVTGKDDWASTAHIARLLGLPIVLVINCSSTSRSIAAIAHGYTTFDPRLTFAGVVLNRVGSDRHLELLQDALRPLNLPILGVLRRQDEITIPDRHLGLIPTDELPELRSVIDRLAHLSETCFNWDILLPLLSTSRTDAINHSTDAINRIPLHSPLPIPSSPIRLAIARDRAFNFYYADNLDLLQTAGFELVEWSPMRDPSLPENIHGLYFGGGFPEVFAAELSDNQAARRSVKAAIAAGMPTYAECGGLMYLCDRIADFAGKTYPMVGVVPTEAQMGKRLTLGYRQAIAQQSTPLFEAGEIVWGHEFHRSSLTTEPEQPLFAMQNYEGTMHQTEGWQRSQVHASYLHLHFGNKPKLIQRFLQQCQHYLVSGLAQL
ncbi:cobyrinate a,c-diamide synthase [Oscillatoria sp. FACHB-1407]|uniref:cobyrinate a,c-diamide synthase n=1 Tax=Oscillatoria sp. FACHB-1407 TaxID=2692847 RepID=UPI0016867F00|nr:cobyrinate a,c-diamide synthase [Oscillatoria sp. FACHB-1407]MBD2463701.1 cobyrinate a,c-diamide synthase [Oscillatoria sp. FACHB-1407]